MPKLTHPVLHVLAPLFAGLALDAAPPPVYLLHNAHVVRVSSPTLEKADVLVRDGNIEAVGVNLKIPADAWVVEAGGLTVYPGFIDALSTWGIPGAAPAAGTGRGARTAAPAQAAPAAPATPAPPPARGPEDRPLNQSFLRAADHIVPTDTTISAAREGGFTTAVVFPAPDNIFCGQGAVVDLAGDRAGDMVVAAPAAQYLTMRTNGFTSFPGSLLGTIAYIRQVYLDADHYKLARSIYAQHPEGLRRPAYDRALEGVLESPRVLLPARRAVEIDRMLRFSKELKVNAILYGGDEAWRWTGPLKESGVPVLVSLKWPERPKDADPAVDDPLRTLELRDKAPSTPAALANARIQFAFYSDGLNTPKDIRKALKKALDAGLTKDQAIRALTLSPAEIYGVADRLGSIDAGKIANLVVTDGDWFDEKTKVKYVYVDGNQFEPVPEEPKKPGDEKPTDLKPAVAAQ
jgi:hypothetical protein